MALSIEKKKKLLCTQNGNNYYDALESLTILPVVDFGIKKPIGLVLNGHSSLSICSRLRRWSESGKINKTRTKTFIYVIQSKGNNQVDDEVIKFFFHIFAAFDIRGTSKRNSSRWRSERPDGLPQRVITSACAKYRAHATANGKCGKQICANADFIAVI